ncbi:MAG: hypothetical protein JO157_12485 [Acetobacteraceae bacterium]|nr:hypothetical protein [Acetobacteraceae bacterium]
MLAALSQTWTATTGLSVPAARRRALLVAAAALLGLTHLWLTVGAGVLLPSDPLWQLPQGDASQAVLGAEAFLRDPAWHFPLGVTSKLLSGGKPESIVYTDSAPWIAILVKAAGLGVGDISVTGLVAVLSVVLQPVAFALLLLALGVRRAESVLIGAALGAMLPAWYMRTVWHVALSSHWVIVLALAVAAWAIRRGVSWKVIAALAALGAFSIGIHAYLFVMVAAVAVGALLADTARFGIRALPRAAWGLGLFLACSALSAWVLGYTRAGSDGGFGIFSMNLLSPVLPQRSGLAEALTGRAMPFLDATGGQYEGFNYLGAGILLVVAVALASCLARGGRMAEVRAGVPLGAMLLALTLFALSNKVFLGTTPVLDLHLSETLEQSLDQVRSSGRMFWPVAYAALAWSILVLDRIPRRALVGAVLGAALVLQGVDTGVVRRVLAEEYAPRPKPAVFDAGPWRNGPFAGHDVRMIPSLACAAVPDHELIRQAALAAERAGGTVEGGPIARSDSAICSRGRSDAVATLGEDGQRLDMLLRRSVPAATLFLAARSGRCAAFEQGAVCGQAAVEALAAGRLKPAAAPPLPVLVPGHAVDFTSAGTGGALLAAGWLAPEDFGAWTTGERALLLLPLPPGWTGDATFAVEATSYGSSPRRMQPVTVLAGGHAVAQWDVPFHATGHFVVHVPAAALAGGLAQLELVIPYPLLSNAAGHIKRKAHGFGLQAITLQPPDPAASAPAR